jgi:crotonobetainyl-CoA:carnitine CoA-transferase CaiB-like acyl-CoA transferase
VTLPLDGIKVLELSEHGFVPAAVAALADFGADVVKIERPAGDPMRRIISSGMVPTQDGYDYLFQLVNRNKRGIALDIETAAGRAVFERLVGWADVYVTNQLPRVRRKLRTEPDDLFALNPRLVYARGHGQGQRGPDAEAGGFDSVSFWSRGGIAHVLTDETAPRPVQQRPALGDVPSGMFLAGGVCAALVHVMRTGKGVVVDTSLLNGATWTLGPDLAYASMTGAVAPMPPDDVRSPLTRQYRTEDGRWVTLMMIDDVRYWAQACEALGLRDLVDASALPPAAPAERDAVYHRIAAVVAGLSHAEVDRRLRAGGCIYAFMATPPEVVQDPAVVANGYLMAHPDHDVRLAAAPAQFDDALPVMRRPGPSIGEHTREVLLELGYADGDIDELVRDDVVVAPERTHDPAPPPDRQEHDS